MHHLPPDLIARLDEELKVVIGSSIVPLEKYDIRELLDRAEVTRVWADGYEEVNIWYRGRVVDVRRKAPSFPPYRYPSYSKSVSMYEEVSKVAATDLQDLKAAAVDWATMVLPDLFKVEHSVNTSTPAKRDYQGDDDMGFTKKTNPVKWQDADFNMLYIFQVRAMAHFLGVRREVDSIRDDLSKRIELRKQCEASPDMAQAAYEAIVLCKVGGKAVPASKSEDEQRVFALASRAVQEEAEPILAKVEARVASATKEVQTTVKQMAKEALAEAAKKAVPIIVQKEGKQKKIDAVLPPEFERMIQLASARIPIMLVGPAGCGKTYLCEKLAEALDMKFGDQSCSEGMSESVFNGLLLPIGKAGGAFEHVSSPFLERYEEGGIMLLDEIDAGDPNLFTYINKAIANDSYTVPQRYKKPTVRKHPDFVLVAAANTFGHGADSMYVGRNTLDAATLDRFKVGLIAMDYCAEVEQSLAPEDLCEWAWKIRKAINDRKLRRIMSTRVIKDLGTMTRRYKWKQPQWERAYFSGWSDEDRRAVQ